jgi:hypothetical protein
MDAFTQSFVVYAVLQVCSVIGITRAYAKDDPHKSNQIVPMLIIAFIGYILLLVRLAS